MKPRPKYSAHDGKVANDGSVSNPASQLARLDTKIWAFGRMRTALSRLPAGTTSTAPLACWYGSAEPQIEQKHRACRVDGRQNAVTLSCPESHLSLPVDENRFAAWADPESLRQYSQWHRKKLSKSPSTSNRA